MSKSSSLKSAYTTLLMDRSLILVGVSSFNSFFGFTAVGVFLVFTFFGVTFFSAVVFVFGDFDRIIFFLGDLAFVSPFVEPDGLPRFFCGFSMLFCFLIILLFITPGLAFALGVGKFCFGGFCFGKFCFCTTTGFPITLVF